MKKAWNESFGFRLLVLVIVALLMIALLDQLLGPKKENQFFIGIASKEMNFSIPEHFN